MSSELQIDSQPNTDTHDIWNIPVQERQNRLLVLGFALFYCVLVATEFRFALFLVNGFNASSLVTIIILALPFAYLVDKAGIFRSGGPNPIVLGHDYLISPTKVGKKKYHRIPLNSVQAMDTRGNSNSAFHILQADNRVFYFPKACFLSETDWYEFPEQVFARINTLPNGPRRVKRLETQRQVSDLIFAEKPQLTWLLIITMLIAFVSLSAGHFLDLHLLAGMGAVSSVLVIDFLQLDRLVTCAFLHAGYLHLMLNLVALLTLGYIIEGILGSKRFFIIFFLSQIVGAGASVLLGAKLSVGSSAAIFGLLGAFLILNIRFRNLLPAGLSMSGKWWFFVIGINALIPILIPRIDIAAHVGGFLVGALVTLYLIKGLTPPIKTAVRRPVAGLYLACMFLAVAATLTGGLRIADATQRSNVNYEVMNSFITSGDHDSTSLNEFAWDIATSKKVEAGTLEIAKKTMGGVLLLDNNHHYRDTLATVLYRQGKFTQAINIEIEALGADPDAGLDDFYAAQLARFLDAHLLYLGVGTDLGVGPNDLKDSVDIQQTKDYLLVDYYGELERLPMSTYILVKQYDDIIGMLVLESGFSPDDIRVVLPENLINTDDLSFALAGIYMRKNNVDTYKTKYWSYTQEVKELYDFKIN